MNDGLSDLDRFPLLNEQSRLMLNRLREHPHGPIWTHPCGERLTADGLARVRAYREEVCGGGGSWWRIGEPPEWVERLAARCLATVPFYRRRGGSAGDLSALPPIDREDLRREPWAFVPDGAPLDDLVVYPTSGTTANRILVLATPEVSAAYLPLIEAALATRGLRIDGGPERVAIAYIAARTRCFTMATVSHYLGGAGSVRINLNPADWRDPDDRARFLDECAPEVYTGDPVAFFELMKIPLRSRPKALVSSATALSPGFQARLEARFGCPAIDLYSTTESGPVAVRVANAGHDLLAPDLYVEVVGPDGRPCRPGARGEIAVTSGRNPLLPLLRYRTGDFAAISSRDDGRPFLDGLEARAPAVFRTTSGRLFNSLDVTSALERFALAHLRLHQAADGPIRLRTRAAGEDLDAVRRALLDLFGHDQRIEIVDVSDPEAWRGKPIQYTSEIALES